MYVCVCMYVWLYVYTYARVSACLYVCIMYVSIYICRQAQAAYEQQQQPYESYYAWKYRVAHE